MAKRCPRRRPRSPRLHRAPRRADPSAALHTELGCDRSDRPLLRPSQAQDLGLEFRGDALREGNEDHRPCFEVVAILEPSGHRSFLLRGHDPGAEIIDELRTELRDAGFGFERITREGREAPDPRIAEGIDEGTPEGTPEGSAEGSEPEHRPTVALLVALPPGREAAELRERVGGSTADWELPLLCPELDDAAGETEAAAEARALVQRWKP